ncbi:MAG: hypothetical protein WKF75_06335 [Singulisphaera sp.]
MPALRLGSGRAAPLSARADLPSRGFSLDALRATPARRSSGSAQQLAVMGLVGVRGRGPTAAVAFTANPRWRRLTARARSGQATGPRRSWSTARPANRGRGDGGRLHRGAADQLRQPGADLHQAWRNLGCCGKASGQRLRLSLLGFEPLDYETWSRKGGAGASTRRRGPASEGHGRPSHGGGRRMSPARSSSGCRPLIAGMPMGKADDPTVA